MKNRVVRAMHYRNRAEEVRTIAESMRVGHAKDLMLSIAKDYAAWAVMMERQNGAGLDLPDVSVVKRR